MRAIPLIASKRGQVRARLGAEPGLVVLGLRCRKRLPVASLLVDLGQPIERPTVVAHACERLPESLFRLVELALPQQDRAARLADRVIPVGRAKYADGKSAEGLLIGQSGGRWTEAIANRFMDRVYSEDIGTGTASRNPDIITAPGGHDHSINNQADLLTFKLRA